MLIFANYKKLKHFITLTSLRGKCEWINFIINIRIKLNLSYYFETWNSFVIWEYWVRISFNVDYFPGFKRAKCKITGYRKYWMLHFGLRDRRGTKKGDGMQSSFFLICTSFTSFSQSILSSFFFVVLFSNPSSNNESNDFLIEKHYKSMELRSKVPLLHNWNFKLNFYLSQCVSAHWTIELNIFFWYYHASILPFNPNLVVIRGNWRS